MISNNQNEINLPPAMVAGDEIKFNFNDYTNLILEIKAGEYKDDDLVTLIKTRLVMSKPILANFILNRNKVKDLEDYLNNELGITTSLDMIIPTSKQMFTIKFDLAHYNPGQITLNSGHLLDATSIDLLQPGKNKLMSGNFILDYTVPQLLADAIIKVDNNTKISCADTNLKWYQLINELKYNNENFNQYMLVAYIAKYVMTPGVITRNKPLNNMNSGFNNQVKDEIIDHDNFSHIVEGYDKTSILQVWNTIMPIIKANVADMQLDLPIKINGRPYDLLTFRCSRYIVDCIKKIENGAVIKDDITVPESQVLFKFEDLIFLISYVYLGIVTLILNGNQLTVTPILKIFTKLNAERFWLFANNIDNRLFKIV